MPEPAPRAPTADLECLRTDLESARAEVERLRGLEVDLLRENAWLREEVEEATFGEIIGQSPPMRAVMRQIELVAPTDATVLVLGESGTGKELVAREIHRRSGRSDRPLVRVNCASIPRELYESEFFGHVRGAFTGAVKDRVGRFQLADRGTLFLDEVGEIPVELQGKLLRVLQEGQYEPVGDARTREVDVRLVAATNRDLRKEVSAGRFREDLFYRLNVFPIEVAPLRRRKEDIPLLASHFLRLIERRIPCPNSPVLSGENVETLRRYDWPGNVRELENVIERAVITAACSGKLRFDFPSEVAPPPPPPPFVPGEGAQDRVLTEEEMRAFERANLEAALRRAGGRVAGEGGAAAMLGIPPTTLYSRLKKMGIAAGR